MPIDICQLFLYPVKSLRGFEVDTATLTPKGFLYDRHWMVIKPNGGFITQRQCPQMVLISTQLTPHALILSAPAMEPLSIPLAPTDHNDSNDHDSNKSNNSRPAKIWQDHCQVIDEGPTASEWLTQAIGTPKPVQLVRMQANFTRPQSKAHLLGAKTHTHFADAAPYLVCNSASLEALNKAMVQQGHKAVTMEHFRPNIVIRGIPAFAEHKVHHLSHPTYQLQHCYPCQRCIIPTIDLNTGQPHPEQQPFSIISDLNSMPNNPKAPSFGENAILTRGHQQTIAVGDTLTAENHPPSKCDSANRSTATPL